MTRRRQCQLLNFSLSPYSEKLHTKELGKQEARRKLEKEEAEGQARKEVEEQARMEAEKQQQWQQHQQQQLAGARAAPLLVALCRTELSELERMAWQGPSGLGVLMALGRPSTRGVGKTSSSAPRWHALHRGAEKGVGVPVVVGRDYQVESRRHSAAVSPRAVTIFYGGLNSTFGVDLGFTILYKPAVAMGAHIVLLRLRCALEGFLVPKDYKRHKNNGRKLCPRSLDKLSSERRLL
jgi:hypothetical protein